MTQHDEYFEEPESGDGPTAFPNERYFISRLGEHLNVTGKYLREVEFEVMKGRTGGRYTVEYSVRDFFALCRGEEPVIINYK